MMVRRRIAVLLATVTLAISVTGCAKLLGSLRRDLDDDPAYNEEPPTVGGRFSERGLLSEGDSAGDDRYVGHAERNPASEGGNPQGGDSWISEDRAAQNRRDNMRGDDDGGAGVSLSNTQNLAPPVKRRYKNGARATRADFVDEAPNEGSLWGSDGQTNYYFTKNKIRGVGDIVTVTFEPDMVKDTIQEVRRTLSPREREYEVAAAQERIRAKTLGLPDPDAKDTVASSAASPSRAPAATASADANQTGGGAATPALKDQADKSIPEATLADIDVGRSLELKAGDSMMGEVLERYPNGNYKIRGTKRIPYKGGPPRYLTLTAIAKGADISEEDVVTSGKLYEYRLESVR